MKTSTFLGGLLVLAATVQPLDASTLTGVRSKIDALASQAGVNLTVPALHAALRGQAGQAGGDSTDRVLADAVSVAMETALNLGGACRMDVDGADLAQARALLAEAGREDLSKVRRASSLLHAALFLRGGTVAPAQTVNRSVASPNVDVVKLELAQAVEKAVGSLLAAK